MYTHAPNDSNDSSGSEDMTPQTPRKTPRLSPPRSSRCSESSPPLTSSTFGSPKAGLNPNAKILETDIDANKRLAHHILNRPNMDAEEHALRTEILWLNSNIADQQKAHEAQADDYVENVRRLRREVRWRQRKLENLEKLQGILGRKDKAKQETKAEEVEKPAYYRGFPEEAVLDCSIS